MSAPSTQHSALSTQHSALSTQHSALRRIYQVLIAIAFFIALNSAHAVQCAGANSSSSGGVDCRRSIVVEDIYSGSGQGLNGANYLLTPTADGAQAETDILTIAQSYGRCFLRTEVLNDWTNWTAWGDAGPDAQGFAVSTRSAYKVYRTYANPHPDGKSCGGAEIQLHQGLTRKQIAKCYIGNGKYDWFYESEGGDGTLVCYGGETLIGYFNGVANTQEDADQSLKKLRKLEADFPSNRGPYKYDTFLNNTACTAENKVACIADIAEVFAQRSTELDGVLSKRWEIFWELLKGNHTSADALTKALQNKLVDRNNSFANLIIGLFDAFVGKIAAIFTNVASLFTGPSTQADVAGHLAKLQKHADKGSGMVLVAHSQGNLFVNEAYKRLKESHPNSKVEVVHVAPASPTLSGGHSLVDIDLVINALRITGINGVPAITKNIPPSDEDKTGHSFVATYMDQARAAYTEIKAMVIASVTKVAPAASN